MSEIDKYKRINNRDERIVSLLVMASFIFFVGTVIYKGIEDRKIDKRAQEKKASIEEELNRLDEENLNDMEIDNILKEAKEKIVTFPEDAQKMLERIERYRGEASYYLGLSDYRKGNIEKAEKRFLKAVELGDAESMYYLGEIHAEKGEYREAEKWFLKAERQGILNSIIRLEEVYHRLNDKEKRKEQLKLLSDRKNTAYMYELGKLYISEGHYIEAEEIFNTLVLYDVIKAKSRINDIKEIVKKENNEKIYDEKILEPEEKISNKDIEGIFNEARRLFFLNREKSIKYFEKIERFKPEVATYLAEHYMEHFDMEKTEKWLLSGGERGELSAMYDLGNFYNQQGKYEEAEKWYRKSLGKKYMRALFKIGEIYDRMGDYKEAEKWYKRAVENGDRGAMKQLATIYLSQGKTDLGEEFLVKSAETGNFDAMVSLAYKYFSEKKYSEAKKIYVQLYELGYVKGAVYIGISEEIEGNYEEAEKWYMKGAEKGNFEAIYRIAYFYDKVKGGKEKGKAIEWYEKASEGGYGIAMYNLAEMYRYSFNDLGLAQKWYMKAWKNGRMNARDRLKEIKDSG